MIDYSLNGYNVLTRISDRCIYQLKGSSTFSLMYRKVSTTYPLINRRFDQDIEGVSTPSRLRTVYSQAATIPVLPGRFRDLCLLYLQLLPRVPVVIRVVTYKGRGCTDPSGWSVHIDRPTHPLLGPPS